LQRTHADPKLAVPALAQLFADPAGDFGNRYSAYRVLLEFGPEARRGIPEIRAVLLDPKDQLFHGAYGVMAAIGPAAVPTLTELANNPDPAVRNAAQGRLLEIVLKVAPALWAP
jgi:HEAT repeat protein